MEVTRVQNFGDKIRCDLCVGDIECDEEFLMVDTAEQRFRFCELCGNLINVVMEVSVEVAVEAAGCRRRFEATKMMGLNRRKVNGKNNMQVMRGRN